MTDLVLQEDAPSFIVGVTVLPNDRPLELAGTLAARFGFANDDGDLLGIRAYEVSLVPRLNLMRLVSHQRDQAWSNHEIAPFGLGCGIGIGYMVIPANDMSDFH